jgi:hypothetical protein
MDFWMIQNGGAAGRFPAGRFLPNAADLPCHFSCSLKVRVFCTAVQRLILRQVMFRQS